MNMTLTKAELADLLFEQLGLNKREAKDMVERFFEEIRLALAQGHSVKLSGFGNFQLREKPQRPGRNPNTGARHRLEFETAEPRAAARPTPSTTSVPAPAPGVANPAALRQELLRIRKLLDVDPD